MSAPWYQLQTLFDHILTKLFLVPTALDPICAPVSSIPRPPSIITLINTLTELLYIPSTRHCSVTTIQQALLPFWFYLPIQLASTHRKAFSSISSSNSSAFLVS